MEKGATSPGCSPGHGLPSTLPLVPGIPWSAVPGRKCPPDGGAERRKPELVPTRGKP